MGCGCGGSKAASRPAPPGWEPRRDRGFPGEMGLKLMTPEETFNHLGMTKIVYRFRQGHPIWVDARDLPSLPRDRFDASSA